MFAVTKNNKVVTQSTVFDNYYIPAVDEYCNPLNSFIKL